MACVLNREIVSFITCRSGADVTCSRVNRLSYEHLRDKMLITHSQEMSYSGHGDGNNVDIEQL